MDIFDQLDLIEKKIQSTPVKNRIASLVNPVTSITTNSSPSITKLISRKNKDVLSSPALSSASTSTAGREVTDFELLPTEIIATESKNLVWAPFYHVHNTLFPARLCSNDEALGEKSIAWPILPEFAVIEMIKQIKYHDTARFLMVEKRKILPYYADRGNSQSSNEDRSRWSLANFETMRQVTTDLMLTGKKC